MIIKLFNNLLINHYILVKNNFQKFLKFLWKIPYIVKKKDILEFSRIIFFNLLIVYLYNFNK
jgi:hypothetical protein